MGSNPTSTAIELRRCRTGRRDDRHDGLLVSFAVAWLVVGRSQAAFELADRGADRVVGLVVRVPGQALPGEGQDGGKRLGAAGLQMSSA